MIPSVLNKCLQDFPHIGEPRKEQKTCLVNLERGKDVFCNAADLLRSCLITKSHKKELSTHSTPDSHYLQLCLEEQAGEILPDLQCSSSNLK